MDDCDDKTNQSEKHSQKKLHNQDLSPPPMYVLLLPAPKPNAIPQPTLLFKVTLLFKAMLHFKLHNFDGNHLAGTLRCWDQNIFTFFPMDLGSPTTLESLVRIPPILDLTIIFTGLF
jgi:hypothetical protein